jgi:hypothetical protein
MKIQYLISLIVLAIAAIAAVTTYFLTTKKEQKPKWIKPGIGVFTAFFLASTVFLSVGAATNQLAKPKAIPVFDPSLNGYIENVENTEGGFYTGEFSGGYHHGKGKLTYADSSVYDGDWQYDKEQGKGKLVSVEGWGYDGDWENGLRAGQGEQTYFDDQGQYFGTYVGAFAADKRNGTGIFTYANGYTQSGEWKNDNFME